MEHPFLRPVESRADGPGLSSRMLVSPDGPALEFIEARPQGAATGAPLLFLHGAFSGAWTWREIFLPLFARRGRSAAAVSLRGHGGSQGHADLRMARLADYLGDVRRAFAEFDEPPVVVAHSLGGLLAQMLIGSERMRGLALLASLPPEGLLFESPRLSLTDPLIWLEAFLGSATDAHLPIEAAAHQVLFSEGLPRERVVRYSSMMTPEAPRVLAEAHLPPPVLPAALFGLPTLVVGGTNDRLVLSASALRTAFHHGAAYRTAEGLGHFMMLDLGAEDVARLVLDWLDEQGF
jgi:pimeloyl-ACP methyl ester carboxylesterase